MSGWIKRNSEAGSASASASAHSNKLKLGYKGYAFYIIVDKPKELIEDITSAFEESLKLLK